MRQLDKARRTPVVVRLCVRTVMTMSLSLLHCFELCAIRYNSLLLLEKWCRAKINKKPTQPTMASYFAHSTANRMRAPPETIQRIDNNLCPCTRQNLHVYHVSFSVYRIQIVVFPSTNTTQPLRDRETEPTVPAIECGMFL